MSSTDFDAPLAFQEDPVVPHTVVEDGNPDLTFEEDVTDVHFTPLQLSDLGDSPVPGYIIAADVNGDPIWVDPSILVHGAPGKDGRDGSNGPPGDGWRGPRGFDDMGPPGPQGSAGARGTTGAVGAPGYDGRRGASGDVGPPGPTGARGARGEVVPGFEHKRPAPGEQGPPGERGATGARGTDGAPGIPGFEPRRPKDGNDGPPGPSVTGATGARGPDGAPGWGERGKKGEEGWPVPGPTGPTGAAGAAGATGPTGPAGPPSSATVPPDGTFDKRDRGKFESSAPVISMVSLASSANPTASLGLVAINGSATTFMRSDAAPALDQTIAPTWSGVHTFKHPSSITFVQVDSVAGQPAVVRFLDGGTNEWAWYKDSDLSLKIFDYINNHAIAQITAHATAPRFGWLGYINVGALGAPTYVTPGDINGLRVAARPLDLTLNDGWFDPAESWTRASDTTINVTDGTKYQTGDKLKFTQNSTVKYFYVVSVSSNVLTVVGQTATTVVTNGQAISACFWSRQQNPLGFPLFTWTPTFSGFSSNPTVSSATWSMQGKEVTVYYTQNALGTSNSVSYTMGGLPIAIANAVVVGPWPASGADGSANLPVNSIRVDFSTTILTFGASVNATNTWTAGGTKGVYGLVIKYTVA